MASRIPSEFYQINSAWYDAPPVMRRTHKRDKSSISSLAEQPERPITPSLPPQPVNLSQQYGDSVRCMNRIIKDLLPLSRGQALSYYERNKESMLPQHQEKAKNALEQKTTT